MDYLSVAAEMRRKAWEAIVASPDFLAFRAADNMVVELGGQSIMPDFSTGVAAKPQVNPPLRVRRGYGKARQSQPDVAYTVLMERGPMQTVELMDVCRERGANIGGGNPINNFRSSLSKDDRFQSFRHNGEYLWWLKGKGLPEGWGEAVDDLLRGTASPSNPSQKGGDGHEANNTDLAS